MNDITYILNAMKKKTQQAGPVLDESTLLSTGSTLLNLALSDRPCGGFLVGKYYLFVGDSSSGKTWICLTCFAEATISEHFKNYRLIYDNVEDGALMNLEKYFGSGIVERLEPPAYDENGEPWYSETVEDFYYNVDDAIKQGTPFIYVLDSQDSLTSEAERKKFAKKKTANYSDTTEAGHFTDGKAKMHSENLRRLMAPLRDSNSILIIISQTRDNLGFGMEKKTRSGGKALRFYAAAELWSARIKTLQRDVSGRKRQIGIEAQVKIKKNRITGLESEVSFPIYHSHGMDDIGASIDFLVTEKFWKKPKQTIKAPEFDFEGTRATLIKHIEDNNLEEELAAVVWEAWEAIRQQSAVKRKNKYASAV